MKKIFISTFIIAAAIITGAIIFSGGQKNNSAGTGQISDNVEFVDGKQIIAISAKGGYFPRTTNAKANMPTVLKMETKGTFDCSSALVIPKLNYRKNLPPTGDILVDIPPQSAGANIRGLCSMGMFSFTLNFN